jgi:hypothetical protein
MKKGLQILVACAVLALAIAQVQAQTNIDYWVQTLNISLTGATNGYLITNGIVAKVKTSPAKITARDLINALNQKPVFRITTTVVTNTVVETNIVHGTNFYITNTTVMAIPVYTAVSNPVYSAGAKLLFKTQLGTNNTAPLIVIRDGSGPSDYVISNYFQMQTVGFNGLNQEVVTSGKFDIVHDVEDIITSSIREYRFNENGLASFPPTNSYFEVQGITTEHRSALIENNVAIDEGASRSLSSTVAGTGQIHDPNGFAVIRGTISAGNGKHEVE